MPFGSVKKGLEIRLVSVAGIGTRVNAERWLTEVRIFVQKPALGLPMSCGQGSTVGLREWGVISKCRLVVEARFEPSEKAGTRIRTEDRRFTKPLLYH
jgi:hypothetical protein